MNEFPASPLGVERRSSATDGDDAASDFPWNHPRTKPTTKLLQIDPVDAAMLKWLAQTTYGDTETSIIKRAIRREMACMFRAKGFVVEEDPTSGAISVRI